MHQPGEVLLQCPFRRVIGKRKRAENETQLALLMIAGLFVVLTSACTDNQAVNAATGAAVGGALGNQVGSGTGKTAATIAGASAGAAIGANAR